MDQDNEEWDPSWSDEEELLELEEEIRLRVPEEPRIQEKNNHNKEGGQSEATSHDDDTDKETPLNSKYDDRQCNKSKENLSDTNLFRRKFYNKEELFKNLAGRQSKDGIIQGNSVHGEPHSTLRQDSSSGSGRCDISKSKNVKKNSAISKPVVVERSKSNGLKCNECGKRFDKKIHLTLHQKIHARMDKSLQLENAFQVNERHQCTTCEQLFETSYDLINHNEKYHPQTNVKYFHEEFICGKCDRRFERSNQLKFHRKMCKASNTISKSTVAVKETVQPFKAPQEQKTNAGPFDFTCEKCDRRFERSNQLKFHRNMCKAGNTISKSISTVKETLQSVKQTQEQKTNLEFTCEKCDRRFERSNQLKFHRNMCKASKIISKSISAVKEPPQSMKQNHERTKCKDSNSSSSDSVVSNEFTSLAFEEHVKSSATATKNLNSTNSTAASVANDGFNCVTCGKTFTNQAAFSQHHLLHKHSIESFEDINSSDFDNVLPFACQQVGCTSRFTDEFDLDYHREKKHNVRVFSNPVYYYINGSQLPPLNPYISLSHEIKEPADAKWRVTLQQIRKKSESTTNLIPRVLKRRFKKARGRQPRLDIPFQNFYVCETCDRKFHKRHMFLIHIAAHKREEKYSCNFCERKFQAKSLLEAHVERHSDPSYVPRAGGRLREDIPIQDVYTCETCGEKFTQRNLFLIHLREEKFKCTVCDRRFQSEALLEAHVERHSDPTYDPNARARFRHDIPIQDVYTCTICQRSFNKRNFFLSHLSGHEREGKFKCTMCDRGFLSESLLQSHMERHSADPTYRSGRRFRDDIPFQDVYTCETCGEKFDQRNLFLLHLREEKFKCTVCDRRFQSEALLEAHVERHSDPAYVPGQRRFRSDIPMQSVYKCETCKKSFKERNYFLSHIAQHKREDKFKCDICERKFLSKTLLEAHVERHSDPSYVPGRRGRWHMRPDIPIQSVYTCDTCQKTFEDRQLYLSHLNQHEREKRLTCNICCRKYSTSQMLQVHMKRHSDPSYRPRRPRNSIPMQEVYTCEKCDRTFINRQRYICHLYYHRTAGVTGKAGTWKTVTTTGKRRPRRPDIPLQDVYFCRICNNKQFSDRNKYIIHLYNHEKTTTRPRVGKGSGRRRMDIPVQDIYYCEQCNYEKSFTDRIKYILHLRNHGLEKRHKCDGCLKMFKTTNARDLHRERFCKNIPCKYKCERCSDRFHNKITLARHFQRFHSKTVPITEPEIEYPCNQCSQTFNTTFGLMRHSQIYHPVADVLLEREAPQYSHDAADNDSPHSWDAEEDNPMLAASFCETELYEETTAEKNSQVKGQRRKLSPGSTLCLCGATRKYKSQKFCHSKRCPCVLAGNRCSKDCDCDSGCLNSNEMELEQQQKFKEGRESMMEMESPPSYNDSFDNEELNDSTPVIIGYSEDIVDDEESYPVIQPEPSTSSMGYNKLIPSEFISVDNSQDESMRQLSLQGYVEGADDIDPLGDPLQEPEVKLVESFSLADTSGIKQSQETQKFSFSTATVSQKPPNASGSASTVGSVMSSKKINNEASSADNFNQSANLRCQFCKKVFKVIPVYISHILNHDLEKASLSCPICTKDFANEVTSYCQHLNIHNKGINLQCTKCSSKFQSYKDMENHLKVHHFRPMECGICTAKFPNSQLMMSHWSKVHPTCQCGLCNVKFFSHDDLTFHMKSLHSPYDCLRCNERYGSLEELLAHFTKQHSAIIFPGTVSQISFKCTYCNDSFSNAEDFNEHLSNHLAATDQINNTRRVNPTNHYECNQCKATFTTTEDLHDHLTHHIMGSNSTTLVYPQQQTSSAQKRFPTLTREIEEEEIHDVVVNDNIQAVQVFTCPKCEKVFQNRHGWKTHVTSHQLIICSACDSCYETKEELVNHLKVTSCMVYFCEVCNRNFQAKKYLLQHKKFVHDGDKKSSTTRKQMSTSSGNMGSTSTGYGDYSQAATTTAGGNALSVAGDSFPVIVASTSLAQRVTSPSQQPTAYLIKSNNLFPSQRLVAIARPLGQVELQREIEEIVLD